MTTELLMDRKKPGLLREKSSNQMAGRFSSKPCLMTPDGTCYNISILTVHLWMSLETHGCSGKLASARECSTSFHHVFPASGLLMFSPSVYDFFFNVRTNQANLLDYKAPSKLINLINKPWFLMDYRNKTSIHE